MTSTQFGMFGSVTLNELYNIHNLHTKCDDNFPKGRTSLLGTIVHLMSSVAHIYL